MLFINFLCLLYLMVLIDSHTISKSIDNYEKIDDIFDSITDIDHTRNPKLRRDRFLHKYRQEFKDEYTKPIDPLKDTKHYPEAEKTTEKLTTLKSTPEHTKNHKAPKKRVGSFWRKFRGKDKKSKHNGNKERKRRIPKNKDDRSKYPATKDIQHSTPRNKNRRQNRNQFILRYPASNFAKRELNERLFTNKENKPYVINRLQIGIKPQVGMMKHHPHNVKPVHELTTENLGRVLATMTSQITRLKELYGIEKFNPSTFYYKKLHEGKMKTSSQRAITTNQKTTEDDYAGTAQIEELLNDIKLKTMQMVAEQNPAITDIILNTVTESTFEADPILRQVGQAVPTHYLSTFLSLNNFANGNEKRTVPPKTTNEFNLNNSVLLTNVRASHNLITRSIKEDTMTMAHNVEDMLQRELKNIYNKVKNKVSCDFKKEVHKVKSTLKDSINKINSKCTNTTKTTTKCSKAATAASKKSQFVGKPAITTSPRHTRGEGKLKKGDKTPENPTPTYDDFMMLTLYEQMLAKTHENNVRKMLSTVDSSLKKRRGEGHLRLSKRNPETLTDVELKNDVQKIYDDGMDMPEDDCMEPPSDCMETSSDCTETTSECTETTSDCTETTPDCKETTPDCKETTPDCKETTPDCKETSPDCTETPSTDSTPDCEAMNCIATTLIGTLMGVRGSMSAHENQNIDNQSSTDGSIADTSFEGLSNKISYKDFVNGFRHYLKFQREQGNQNFSNLVKYQAHRHHSVDDIGKYILSKIPAIPSNRRKRFFDDTDFDYQEISTKSDDSWFRKHFYLFIDNGPPKKFHTSQTVELKSAMTEPYIKLFVSEPQIDRPDTKDQIFIKIGSDDQERNGKDTGPMSLDDLTRVLDSIKDKQSTSSHGHPKSSKDSDSSIISINETNSIVNLKMLPHNIMDKLFGNKHRRTPNKVQQTTEYYPAVNIYNAELQKRIRRTVTKDDIESTVIDDFINKDFDEKPSTMVKAYADTAVRSSIKETNKYGYVDIDLVPRQTAIVKLRENKPKKNSFKEFFKKFHFKKNKDKKQAKRYCEYYNCYTQRRARFNPFKKLRDMFKVESEDKEKEMVTSFRLHNSLVDYEMMTTQIESFKPIKYDKPMSIDEMRKQIPNISDTYNYDSLIKHSTSGSSNFFNLDESDQNLLYNYPLTPLDPFPKFPSQILPSNQSLTTTTSQPITTTFLTTTRKPTTITMMTHKLPSTNVMTVNLKTLKYTTSPITKTSVTPYMKSTKSTASMTLEDMGVILNNIQLKLSKTTREYPNLNTQYYKRGTVPYGKKRAPGPLKKPLDVLTIRTKLTRIGKFPISKRHFKTSRRDELPYIDDEYLNFQEEPIIKERNHEVRNRNAPNRNAPRDQKKMSKFSTIKKLQPNIQFNNEKYRYTDYFNDLIMWHNDILNLDKVPNPTWKNILKNIEAESLSYTTPNMSNLLVQLNELNDFLGEDSLGFNRLLVTLNSTVKETTTEKDEEREKDREYLLGVRSLPDVKQGAIRSLAMNDNAVLTSNNLLIKGEAKYYQYNKPTIVEDQLKPGDFVTNLYKFNAFGKNSETANNKAKGSPSKVSPLDNNEPAILVDTTLMAYDDDVDSITEGLDVKKLSRHSKISKPTSVKAAKNPLQSPFLKTNKPPMQYYTTPLPMKSYEFDKFLREHKMDVESVTSPMFDLPSLIDHSWNGKATKPTHPPKTVTDAPPFTNTRYTKTKKISVTIGDKTDKIEKHKTTKKHTTAAVDVCITNPIIKQSDSERKKDNRGNKMLYDSDRHKRYSVLRRHSRNTQELNYYDLFKKKMKLFEKKAPPNFLKPKDTFTIDPRNKEVEITIINFDDMEKLTSYKPFDSYNPSALKKENTPTTISLYTEPTYQSDEVETPTTTIADGATTKDVMHNELLYKNTFKEHINATTEFTVLQYPKNTEYVDPITTDPTSRSINKLRYPFDFLNRLPHAKGLSEPKRVHISSHHYKYDIFYNDDKKTIKPGIERYRQNLAPKEKIPVKDMRQMKIKTHHRRYSTIFRNNEARTEMIKKIDRTGNRNRHARNVLASVGGRRHRLFPKRGCKPKAEPETITLVSSALTERNYIQVSTQKREVKATTTEATITVETAATPEATMEAPPVSIVYDLKHLKRTSPVPIIKESRKSIFKLTAFLQERLKSLMRNMTSKTPGITKRGPKSDAKGNYTSNDTAAASCEDASSEGFKIFCGASPELEHKITTTTPPPTSPAPAPCRTPPPTRPKESKHGHAPKTYCVQQKAVMPHDMPKDTLYVEPENYDDQSYYELGPQKAPPTPCPDPYPDELKGNEKQHNDVKRELQQHNVYTAKDVAALEVIVDLMKNTPSYEEKDIASVFNNHYLQPHATKSVLSHNDSTNSIQVHIAIPFDFESGKKRSPLNPVRLRKVFSAKMSTPVDLEYQVHSFEGTFIPPTTLSTAYDNSSSSTAVDGLSPGMYLLVDKPRNGYALKPVKATINLSDLKARQAPALPAASMTEGKPTEARDMDTTSLKSLAKVTLSKDFIAAVNKHLIELYENISANNESDAKARISRSVWKARKSKEEQKKFVDNKYVSKRRIDWEGVKKYFGHDRVCSCKCKANKTMCRACAASDAVIDELIFEFDNIGRYMKDHCTEIQTFFWMNPAGGQKLREAVNRIDKSLGDYYKRVKGKCQGRTCKTFTTYIDKRQIVKTSIPSKEDIPNRLIEDLMAIADDLNKVVSLKACYNHRLKEEGDKFLQALNTCMTKTSFDKRSIATKKKLVKNVYSLDNINVNIICNPDVTPIAPSTEFDTTTSVAHTDFTQRVTDQLLDYGTEDTKVKKRKGFKKLFPRKSKKEKLFSYFTTDSKKSRFHYKRDIGDHVATPLISDGGGSFWLDYLKSSTNDARIASDSQIERPNLGISVIQKTNAASAKADDPATEENKKVPTVNTMYMAVKASTNIQREVESTTDDLTANINQLLQLFGSLQDIESMNQHSNYSTTYINPLPEVKTGVTKKCTKCTKKVETTIHYKNVTTTKSTLVNITAPIGKLPTLSNPNPVDLIETIVTGTSTLQPTIPKDLGSDNSTLAETSNIVTTTKAPKQSVAKTTPPLKKPGYSTKAKKPSTKATKKMTNTRGSKIIKLLTAIEVSADDELPYFNQPLLTNAVTQGTTAASITNFLGKVKTATIRYFDKTYENSTKTIDSERLSSGIINRLSDAEMNLAELGDTSKKTTLMSPTIVIINEYDNQINSDALENSKKDLEGYRNLLLSIIQYETNRLNDEWHKIAYGDERDDGNFKRSIVMDFSKTDEKQATTKTKNCTKSPLQDEGSDIIKSLKSFSDLQIPDPQEVAEKKKCEGLLNKIVNKFGMKIVCGKKKPVVKQPNVRQACNNRRLRKKKGKTKSWRSTPLSQEACDARRKSKQHPICDIQATYKHIIDLQSILPSDSFENLVRNISCYKYKNVSNSFYIPYKREGRRWDWIRNRRSLKQRFDRVRVDSNVEVDNASFDNNDDDSFEKFVKGDDGIYKVIKRNKRTVRLKALDLGLRNIPVLVPGENQLFALAGDNIVFDCHLPDMQSFESSDGQVNWRTDRRSMLDQDNVKVDGVTVAIRNVQPRNVGSYVCSQDNIVQRKIRLSVVAIPAFDVVFLPLYETDGVCSYDDLKAIQRLRGLMAEEMGCGNICSVRMDEPVCLRERGTNRYLIRSTAVISIVPLPINCSVQCRRDVVSSLVMLCAANTPTLSSIEVVVSTDGLNETLLPAINIARPLMTHGLRKKDSNGHREYHKLVSSLSPGKVDVVLICPAGYYLLPEFKICASCPANSSSAVGDNTCTSCPDGTRSPPGAARCTRPATHPRRYDWWWYPTCGYLVAAGGLVCCCGACATLAMFTHIAAAAPAADEPGYDEREGRPNPSCSVTATYAHVRRARPLSPSRVILARFFKPSLTSSRATDSQETKFELWKERNIPPPLPPVDFDF